MVVPMRVPLSLACEAYDRTFGLARGDVQSDGIDLTETREAYVI
jgi:hypothetical protein